MNLGKVMPLRLKWIMEPMGRWVLVVGVAASLAAIYGLLVPISAEMINVGVYVWMLIGCTWAARQRVRRWVVRRYQQPPETTRVDRTRERWLLWLFAITIATVITGWPLYVKFLLLRPSMERAAITAIAAHAGGVPYPSTTGQTIAGSYVCPHGVWFPFQSPRSSWAILAPTGYVYAPQRPCRNVASTRIHLFGSWYAYQGRSGY